MRWLVRAGRASTGSQVREVQVAGEWAYVWSELVVETTLPTGTTRRQGPTLSIFRKDAGRWRLARDANLLGPPASE